MSVEWPEYSLGDLLEITSSKRIFRADYVDDGVPFFRSKEVIEQANGNKISTELFITKDKFEEIKSKFGAPIEGDILLTSVGTLGVSYQVEKEDEFYFKDGNLTWFRNFSDKISSRFLLYWLRSPIAKRAFEMITIGSTQKALTIVSLKKIKINLPDIETQLDIVKVLDSLEGKLNNNRQINQTLEQIAQAIFKSWFVDFEPTKAKIEAKQNGQDPERAAMRAISSKTNEELDQLSPEQRQQLTTTAALFPDELEDSELGEIPKGWGVTRFKDIVEKYIDNRGKTPPTADKGIPLLEVKHLPENELRPNLNTTKYVDQETYDSWFRAHLEEDDIIISTVGTIGRICLVPKDEKLTIAQNLLGLRFDRKKASPYFMYYQMNGFRFRHDVDARLVITVQQSIKRKDLETIDLLFPTIEIQDEFERFIKPFVNKQQGTENEILCDLRDSLLPKLLSGEIPLIVTKSTAEAVA